MSRRSRSEPWFRSADERWLDVITSETHRQQLEVAVRRALEVNPEWALEQTSMATAMPAGFVSREVWCPRCQVGWIFAYPPGKGFAAACAECGAQLALVEGRPS